MPTVLICDNEASLRLLVRDTLADDEDYILLEARDGDEALDVIKSSCPDLIVLDMMMPGRSGLDVLDVIRSDPELRDTRVVMLTARAQARDREAALTAGADAFVTKPFSPLELISVVEDLLARDG